MPAAQKEPTERARRVRLMIFDVDGVMTDGRLWYGPQGEALKAFHSLDGHGIKMLIASGVSAAILSGRRSEAVALRARELGIAHVLQGIEEKRTAFERLLDKLAIAREQAGFMGDDVMDLPVLRRCGFACATREAPEMVRSHAHYVPESSAGFGAVREVCELLMRAQDTWQNAIKTYLAD